jgi:hypothetical protein
MWLRRGGWVFEFKYDESPDLEGVISQGLKYLLTALERCRRLN